MKPVSLEVPIPSFYPCLSHTNTNHFLIEFHIFHSFPSHVLDGITKTTTENKLFIVQRSTTAVRALRRRWRWRSGCGNRSKRQQLQSCKNNNTNHNYYLIAAAFCVKETFRVGFISSGILYIWKCWAKSKKLEIFRVEIHDDSATLFAPDVYKLRNIDK